MEIAKNTTVRKSQKQINAEIVAKHRAKHNRMIRGQFLTYGVKGLKDMQLTYKIAEGNVHKKHVKHGDIIELPFGYIKYLNSHGSVKRTRNSGMSLEDSSGARIAVREEDNELRYSFRILDVLSSEELAELEPDTIIKAGV